MLLTWLPLFSGMSPFRLPELALILMKSGDTYDMTGVRLMNAGIGLLVMYWSVRTMDLSLVVRACKRRKLPVEFKDKFMKDGCIF